MKARLDDLAIFGGPKSFKETLHVGRPNIGDRERLQKRFDDILDRRWLTNNGPYVREFEKQIAEHLGVRNVIAVCNATIGLEIAVRALDLSGEVIVPSMTFVATAHALLWQQVTPVFCDIDPLSCCIDPGQIEAMITPKTTGIIGVHLWGRPCDCDAIEEIAKRHKLKVLYDAAHAFGCSHEGRMLGNFGDVEVFSFHATKFLNSFEGGAIVTNNDSLAKKMRLMTNFGFKDVDDVISIGTNGKMTEISAAMGITSLESVEQIIQKNYANYKLYGEEIENIPGVTIAAFNEKEKNNYQYVILFVEEEKIKVSRDMLVDIFWAENVLARRYFFPGVHRLEPYRSYFPHAKMLLPVTERVSQQVLSMPSGLVTPEEIKEICQILSFTAQHGADIRARLEAGEGHINRHKEWH